MEFKPAFAMKGKPQGDDPADAVRSLCDLWSPIAPTEVVPVADALNRVLVKDQFAQFNIPTSRAARMDGVCIRSADFADGIPDTSTWVKGVDWDRADMGDDFDDAFDAVIAVEQVDLTGDVPLFYIDRMPQPGDSINPCGGTLQKDRLLVKGGTLLSINLISLLVMGGITQVEVVCRPKVAFIPTGSELVAPGETPGRGQVVDSNSVLAKHLLEEYGAEVHMYPIIKDDQALLEHVMDEALETCDVVLFNGGSSKGSEDFNKPLLAKRGTITTLIMNSGPGRPVGAGVINGKAVLVCPGPPMSMVNVMEYFVSSLIDCWLGIQTHRHTVHGVLDEDIDCAEHMMFLVNAHASRGDDGRVHVAPHFFRHGQIEAMQSAGYLHHPIGTTLLPAGSEVNLSLWGSRQQNMENYPYA